MSDNSESLSGAMTTSNSMPKMSPSKEALHFTKGCKLQKLVTGSKDGCLGVFQLIAKIWVS
jgi:hypothetical protein